MEVLADKESGVLVLVEEEYVTLFLRSLDYVFVFHILGGGGFMSRDTIRLCGEDQIIIKTPNPKCRLYWCLIKFREIQSVILIFSTPLAN
jgi:hypothetical protein